MQGEEISPGLVIFFHFISGFFNFQAGFTGHKEENSIWEMKNHISREKNFHFMTTSVTTITVDPVLWG